LSDVALGDMSLNDIATVSEIFVALSSLQVSAIASFYQAVTGTAPKVNTPNYAEFRLEGLRLAIFAPKPENQAEFESGSSGPMSLCLEVTHLEGVIKQLAALGYPPSGEVMHTSHGQEIYAYDPDGNRLILHQSVG